MAFNFVNSHFTCSQSELGNFYNIESIEESSRQAVILRNYLNHIPVGKSIICNINPNRKNGKQIIRCLASIGFKKIASYYGDQGGLVHVMFWTNRPVEKKKRKVKSPQQ